MSGNDMSTTSGEDCLVETGPMDDSEAEGIVGGVGNPVRPEPIDKNEGPEECKGAHIAPTQRLAFRLIPLSALI